MSLSEKKLSCLICGYIRNIELLLDDNKIIPDSITILCFKFYDSEYIHIFCRIRPLLPFEIKKQYISCITSTENDNNEYITIHDDNKDKNHNFKFDKIYNDNTSQETISNDLKKYIDHLFDGVNLSIFVYGQTGAGKTFTMHGHKHNPGILINSMKYIFDTINIKQQERENKIKFELKCSIFHVYNEKINDMIYNIDDIDDINHDLKIKKDIIDKNKNKKYKVRHLRNGEVIIEDLTWIRIKSMENLIFLNETERKNFGSFITMMSARSSRFNKLILVNMYCINSVDDNIEYISRINFIDCAGSERVKKSGATGQRLKEAQNINKSLSAIGDVLQSLQRKDRFIPFRNSTITDLLSSYLSNNNNQIIFYLNICPSQCHSFQTVYTLKFGTRISKTEINNIQQKKNIKKKKRSK